MTCTLCQHEATESFTGVDNIKFWKCNNCYLVFKDSSFHLHADKEKERYSQHNNTDECPGYKDFLNQALEPASKFVQKGMEGMDFGCGPNPVLAKMITQAGYDCSYFDPFFFPQLPDERQDFIFATECFEHFFNPVKELNLITSLLIPSGYLIVMTHRWNESTDFNSWWYMRDETHVSFLHLKTFEYLCQRYGLDIVYDDGEKVIILQKIVARK
jgi:hypothetical protein